MRTGIIIVLTVIIFGLVFFSKNTSGFTSGDTLYSGDRLTEGQQLISRSGSHKAVMQTDGNFVVYNNKTNAPTWASQTNGKGVKPRYLAMQTDGNLVVYGKYNKPWWASGTNGKGDGGRVTMQGDGNLVIYDINNKPTWASNTYGK